MTTIPSNARKAIMPEEIADFIKANKVATICCIDEDAMPYCFNCVYSFLEDAQLILFKSSEESHHSKLLLKNDQIAGTILPDSLNLLSPKGIQFSGRILYGTPAQRLWYIVNYHTDHPVAITKPGHVWCVQLEAIKMTDSTYAFGKKVLWNRG